MASSMIRGFLNILVLKELDEGPKSGYELMKRLEERVGTKPSPGSIYPLLEELKKDRLVAFKGDGRSKEYHLTAEGKKRLKMIDEKREECLKSFLGGMKMLSAMTGEDMTFPMAMVDSMRKGVFPFKEINPEWDQLREALFVMMRKNTLGKNARQVRKIISNALREMKSL
jgi:DNA-binding PadR family transcriptional regulator